MRLSIRIQAILLIHLQHMVHHKKAIYCIKILMEMESSTTMIALWWATGPRPESRMALIWVLTTKDLTLLCYFKAMPVIKWYGSTRTIHPLLDGAHRLIKILRKADG